MKKTRSRLNIGIILVVVIVSYLIYTSSPKINKDPQQKIIYQASPNEKDRNYAFFFRRSDVDIASVAEFFGVTAEEIREVTERFEKELSENVLLVPIK